VIPLQNRDERSNQRYVNRQWKTVPFVQLEFPQGPVRLKLKAAEMPEGQTLDFKSLAIKRIEP
jgi:hypothetical protein